MRNCKIIGQQYKSGRFNVQNKDLTSLEGCPQHITGDFICTENWLQTLVGGPQKVDGDYCSSYTDLTDLVGCAGYIGGSLYVGSNNITSLVGIHKIIKSCPRIQFENYKVKVGGIGLLLINDLNYISGIYTPFEIIKSYLGTGTKGMMECSKELKAKGYEEYAKL